VVRDNNGLFITGTDTGVGKTVITAGLLGALRRRGINAIAIKPIQSGGILRKNQLVSEDANFYGAVTDLSYTPHRIKSYLPASAFSSGCSRRSRRCNY